MSRVFRKHDFFRNQGDITSGEWEANCHQNRSLRAMPPAVIIYVLATSSVAHTTITILVMSRIGSPSRYALFAACRQTAANREDVRCRTHPTSMFEETLRRSVDGATIFDLSAIISQAPDRSLLSLGDRATSRVLSELTGGTDFWDSILNVPPIETIETHESSADSSKRSGTIAIALLKHSSWYFYPDNLRTWAGDWKLERQIGLFVQDCERAFPQATRLEFISDPALKIPGNERLLEVGRRDPVALASAESSASGLAS